MLFEKRNNKDEFNSLGGQTIQPSLSVRTTDQDTKNRACVGDYYFYTPR